MNDSVQMQERENQRSPLIPEQSTPPPTPQQNRPTLFNKGGSKEEGKEGLKKQDPRSASDDHVKLAESVKRTVSGYLDAMQGQEIEDLYELVLSEIEAPLLEGVMQATGNNQSLTAKMLGLNRGTLRKKMKKYGML